MVREGRAADAVDGREPPRLHLQHIQVRRAAARRRPGRQRQGGEAGAAALLRRAGGDGPPRGGPRDERRPEKPEPAEQRGRRPRRRGAGHEAGDPDHAPGPQPLHERHRRHRRRGPRILPAELEDHPEPPPARQPHRPPGRAQPGRGPEGEQLPADPGAGHQRPGGRRGEVHLRGHRREPALPAQEPGPRHQQRDRRRLRGPPPRPQEGGLRDREAGAAEQPHRRRGHQAHLRGHDAEHELKAEGPGHVHERRRRPWGREPRAHAAEEHCAAAAEAAGQLHHRRGRRGDAAADDEGGHSERDLHRVAAHQARHGRQPAVRDRDAEVQHLHEDARPGPEEPEGERRDEEAHAGHLQALRGQRRRLYAGRHEDVRGDEDNVQGR
mmetsp:Transcript_24008/g.71444  ORF Transcript_24008/g.71444 Transcript_24008/m.71444 type:complete len:382 (+) Transcript_24008:43-1188(+)